MDIKPLRAAFVWDGDDLVDLADDIALEAGFVTGIAFGIR
jgi:hypothetical protein